MEAGDRVPLPEVEAVRLVPVHARAEVDRPAALVAGELDEVGVQQPAVAVRAPGFGGHEVVHVHVKAADQVRGEAIARRGAALVAVEQSRHPVPLRMTCLVPPPELGLVEVGAELLHHSEHGREALVPGRDLQNLHAYRPYERPMTSSMISSVPAPIRFSRMSRHARSTPYSRM